MPSPNFDNLNLRLSRLIGEPVSTAADNGVRWSSVQRSAFLNSAIKKFLIMSKRYVQVQAYAGNEAQPLVAGSKALSAWTGGVLDIISAYNVNDNIIVKEVTPNLIHLGETGGNSLLLYSPTNQCYDIQNNTFYLLDGTGSSTDSIKLKYIKQHADLSVAGATDILIPSEYWETILDIATQLVLEETPTQQNIQRAMVKEAAINKVI